MRSLPKAAGKDAPRSGEWVVSSMLKAETCNKIRCLQIRACRSRKRGAHRAQSVPWDEHRRHIMLCLKFNTLNQPRSCEQSFTTNWPRTLWLAIDQKGIHLLEHRSRNVLCTYGYDSIISFSPNLNSLMIFTGTEKKQSKVILTTSQAYQITTLIREYSEAAKDMK
ncbi:uncharacterized protein LOC120285683 [Drosophila simulans]|uniref:uncharacterized protein LOC120285683 n=1 Tax=Drosophila simulans TaxID=7240 RepID=UPI00192CFE60|nr:uncharacterized protein LOC120285683 [Drosophila simulans]